MHSMKPAVILLENKLQIQIFKNIEGAKVQLTFECSSAISSLKPNSGGAKPFQGGKVSPSTPEKSLTSLCKTTLKKEEQHVPFNHLKTNGYILLVAFCMTIFKHHFNHDSIPIWMVYKASLLLPLLSSVEAQNIFSTFGTMILVPKTQWCKTWISKNVGFLQIQSHF